MERGGTRKRAGLRPFRFVAHRGVAEAVRLSGRPARRAPADGGRLRGLERRRRRRLVRADEPGTGLAGSALRRDRPRGVLRLHRSAPGTDRRRGAGSGDHLAHHRLLGRPRPGRHRRRPWPEPQLRWRAYCDAFVELALALRTGRVVILGAYLAEVAHSRPVPLAATASDAAPPGAAGPGPLALRGADRHRRRARRGARRGRRPDGHDLGERALLLDSRSRPRPRWRSPRRRPGWSARHADLAELAREAQEYERQMDELVGEDETVAAYVARIAATKTPPSRTPRSRSSPTRSSATCATNPPGRAPVPFQGGAACDDGPWPCGRTAVTT